MYASIEIEKTRQKITDAMNESKLPFCILQLIMKELSTAVDILAAKERESDLKAMEKVQAEQEESQDK